MNSSSPKIKAKEENQIVTQTLDSENFLFKLFETSKESFGEDNFNKWLNSLEIFEKSKSEIILSAPSKFIRDWVIREFLETPKNKINLLKISQKIDSNIKKLSIIYNPKKVEEEFISASGKDKKIVNLSKYDNIFTFGVELNKKYTFENFISAKYNKLAVSMAKIAAGVDSQINLFEDKIPLYIHGGVGMGKTHLAQAIAWKIKEFDKKKKVVYLSAERFMYHFVQSIRSNDVMDFKEKIRSVDVLIIDDLQFIAGKTSTQQEFMNCFNSLVDDNKQVILVCDRCPTNLENIDEKLKSRISGGMVVNFKSANFQDRLHILNEKAKQYNHEIPEDVLKFIAEKVTNSIRDLEGALKKIIAENIFNENEISIINSRVILAGYIRKSDSKTANIIKIQKLVAAQYNLKLSDFTSSSRLRSIARPRQVAMYLAKELTKESLPKIGKEFGGKNHATVIYSHKLISKMMKSDIKIYEEVKTLEEKLK